MIKRQAELTVVQSKEMRGGKGTVTMEHFMDQAMANGAGRLFAKTTLPPGASIGRHTHEGDSEVYYILEGKGKINDNGVIAELAPGDSAFCPDGSFHEIENTGASDLVFIAIVLFTKQHNV
ncbi:oxalate-binding protein [Deltaproteobacteria bacterium]|nr:oxalate-binding protein [Deltaproteobacteria bacterium]